MTASAEPTAPLRASRKRVPDFFIVGAPKSGTTSLYQMLRRHPQIYMPDLKEPRFLASDMRPRAGFSEGPKDIGYPVTLDDYLALFDDAMPEQRVGEASTSYLWSRTAAATIAELQPDARIIAILREPASFLRSLHLTYLLGRNETVRDLRRAMALEADRREGRHIPRRSHRPQVLQYSEHVRYVEQLRRYHDRFPPEQVLVLIYEDFRDHNEATVRQVLRFLDVDDECQLDLMNVNVTKRTVRSWRLKELLNSVSKGAGPASRGARAAVKTLTTRQLRRGAIATIYSRAVVTEPPPPDESFMLELRRRFKGEVVALSEYLDRDLVSLWGYEDVE
jgi:sulfotransferase family protein